MYTLSILLSATTSTIPLLTTPQYLNIETEKEILTEEELHLCFWDKKPLQLTNSTLYDFLIKKMGVESYFPIAFEKHDLTDTQIVYYCLEPIDRILMVKRHTVTGVLVVKLLSLEEGKAKAAFEGQ